MAHTVTKFHLVGPYAGKTVTLGAKKKEMGRQFEFVDGVYTFEGSDKEALNIGNYLKRCYQAYPEGPLLEAAQKAAAGGEPAAPANPEPPQKPVEPTPPANPDPLADDNDKPETIVEALNMLDPENDEHWTSRKLAQVDEVEKLLGREVTRAEIEEAAPDFDREAAKAAKE